MGENEERDDVRLDENGEWQRDQDDQEESVECPDCGSQLVNILDGLFYDDDQPLGFGYDCTECGARFYER